MYVTRISIVLWSMCNVCICSYAVPFLFSSSTLVNNSECFLFLQNLSSIRNTNCEGQCNYLEGSRDSDTLAILGYILHMYILLDKCHEYKIQGVYSFFVRYSWSLEILLLPKYEMMAYSV